MSTYRAAVAALLVAAGALVGKAGAAPVAFTNVADDPSMNLRFERARSASRRALDAFYERSLSSPVALEAVFATTCR